MQDSSFPGAGHDHAHCLHQALDRADALCAERGIRMTDLRRRVLEIVWSGHKPMGAYRILEVLQAERGSAAPPTVYRALDFLSDNGLVHRIESLNAYVGCPEPEVEHGGQFLICRACGSAAEIADPRIDAAIDECARDAGFEVGHRAMVEIEGLCPHCKDAVDG